MKAQIVISFGAAAGLAVLSAIAFMSAADSMVNLETEHETALENAVLEETAIDRSVLLSELLLPEPDLTEAVEELKGQTGNLQAEDACLLARIAMAEAEGEDTKGKALVMLVVLNRVQADEFPDTIEEVIYQPGQFSPVSNGRFDIVEPDTDCWAALDWIMLDKWNESFGATYFESKSNSTWHSENLAFLFQHGNHYFYKDREEDSN